MIEFTFPCSKGAIDVVETPNAALDAKVLCVVLAEFLGCKLLQAIGILRLSRPGIRFLQAHICFKLLEFRVNACTRGIEEPASPKRYKILVNELKKLSCKVQT